MKLLGNPSNYLLPVLNAAILVDIIYIYLAYSKYGFNVTNLRNWYMKFKESAVIADVLILVIGFIITTTLYPYIFGKKFNLFYYLGLLLAVQVIHDLLFAFLFYNVPRGDNYMLDEFKKYGNEIGVKAILGDSSMIALTFFAALMFCGLGFQENLIALVVLVYLTPYFLFIRYQ
jgi:hypothetical protein